MDLFTNEMYFFVNNMVKSDNLYMALILEDYGKLRIPQVSNVMKKT